MASPCIDICRYDDTTGWCLGCGMTKPDKKLWKKDKSARPSILAPLGRRLSELSAAGQPTGKAAKRKKKRD